MLHLRISSYALAWLASAPLLVVACAPAADIARANDNALGGEGQPPYGNGTCNAGLTNCGTTCSRACGTNADAGLPTSDAATAGDGSVSRDAGGGDSSRSTDSGTLEVVATGNRIAAIALDGASVYWAESNIMTCDGRVVKSPKSGGASIEIANNQSAPVTISVDSTSVYWTNFGCVDAQSVFHRAGSVMSAPLGGGTLHTLASDLELPVGTAIDAGWVYWFSWGVKSIASLTSNLPGHPNPATDGLWRVRTDGTLPQQLDVLTGISIAPVVAGASVYYTNIGNRVSSAAPPDHVRRFGIGGSTHDELTSVNEGVVDGIVSDGASMYVTYQTATLGGTTHAGIFSIPVGGGAQHTIAIITGFRAVTLAIGGADLYWIEQDVEMGTSYSVKKVSTAGGPTITLATGQYPAGKIAMAIDATHVYWSTGSEIVRIPK